MKHFVKPAAVIAAACIAFFSQPAMATVGHPPIHATVVTQPASENAFSIELNHRNNREVVFATIKNPGRKNLCVTLIGPDGSTVDNFFTGKKHEQVDKVYNFTDADAGTYTLAVSDGVEKIKKEIKLERIAIQAVSKLTVQ